MELSCSTATRLIPCRSSYNLPTKKVSSFISLSSSNSLFLSAAGSKKLRSSAPVQRSGGGGGPTGGRRIGTCRCLFGLGVPEMVVIAGVAALVFGPKQLPEIGRSIGKTFKSFQQAAKEFESELKKDPEDGSQPSSAEGFKAISSEDEKKELGTSDTKGNV